MKLINLEQGTKEWLKWREDGIGGSEIGAVVGINPYQTAYQLFQVKAKLTAAEDLSNNFAVKRGTRLEPMALKFLNGELNGNFKPMICEHDSLSWAKYSCDGFDESRNETTEIKCMGDKNHQMILDLKPDWKLEDLDAKHPLKYYMPQKQWGLGITGAKTCHFVSYNPSHPLPYKRIEIAPDKDMQDFLFIQGGQFWKLVLSKTPPELTDKDFEKIKDAVLDGLVARYKKQQQHKKTAETWMEKLKADIFQHSKGRNLITESSKVFSNFKKGAVDYEKIEALKGVDLEQYRKPSISIFYIK